MVDQDFPVVRADVLRHRAGERALIDAGIREPHADRRHARVPRSKRRDDARIEPAREQQADGHVGHQMLAHDLGQCRVQFIRRTARACAGVPAPPGLA